MKNYDFIQQCIINNSDVYITGDDDLGMDGELREFIRNRTIES